MVNSQIPLLILKMTSHSLSNKQGIYLRVKFLDAVFMWWHFQGLVVVGATTEVFTGGRSVGEGTASIGASGIWINSYWGKLLLLLIFFFAFLPPHGSCPPTLWK